MDSVKRKYKGLVETGLVSYGDVVGARSAYAHEINSLKQDYVYQSRGVMQELESDMAVHDINVGVLRHDIIARRQRAAYANLLGSYDPYARVPLLPYNSALPLGISSRPDPYLARG